MSDKLVNREWIDEQIQKYVKDLINPEIETIENKNTRLENSIKFNEDMIHNHKLEIKTNNEKIKLLEHIKNTYLK